MVKQTRYSRFKAKWLRRATILGLRILQCTAYTKTARRWFKRMRIELEASNLPNGQPEMR